MKRLQSLLFGFGIVIMTVGMVMLSTSCEGPEGPEGVAGIDGNGTCGECHNVSTEVKAKMVQYDNSVHKNGGNYARSTTDCAPCHTNEGFLETQETGLQKTAFNVDDPTPVGCRTCHKVHETYTYADMALRTTTPVKLWANETVTANLGDGNLCLNCHQSRPATPAAVVDGPDVAITSNRWGPHHGPQGQLLLGVGGFEIKGSTPYGSTVHKTAVSGGCIGCHMSTPYGNQSGGHNMGMSYDYHGAITRNVTSCVKCHEGAKNFDINGVQTTVDSLLEVLKEELIAKKIYDTTTALAIKGTFPANVAGAYWNFIMIEEDRSVGIHNPKYAIALLKNSIEAVK